MKRSPAAIKRKQAYNLLKNRIVKPSLILMAVALFATLALSHIKRITEENIRLQERMKQENALAMVLPGYTIAAQKQATVNGETITYWSAEKAAGTAVLKAYAFVGAMSGYSGVVKSMVGVSDTGVILGISIMEQTETPGLGTRCTEVPSTYTIWDYFFHKERIPAETPRPWFQEQFSGLNVNDGIAIVKMGDWTPVMRQPLIDKKAITAITGATITSRAVTKGIEKGYNLLREALAQEAAANQPQTTIPGGVR